ncbi:ABC transporter substrate-binding protein [Halorarum salinum]|uniref:ABC transporter substrate-binding protein n=1 Tax=Halorarum salinum TaxID=2743089 RepID=A0A7D5QCF1_9EURY|nr:ABC transporter substrate-binding protein [Halobaculum salinum]QLG61481.1 ABC transporter substrate-binding protein [Halobaculum salinum]
MTNETRNHGLDRRSVLKGLSAGAALSLAGCTGPLGGGGGGDSGGTLYYGQVKGPLDLDPVVLNDVPSAQVAGQIYDGLYEYDLGLNVQPKLAADQPEVERDGTRFVVPLREGAEFWNGDAVTASDVVHTFLAPVEEETENAAELDMIDSAEAVDETTVQFDLAYPYGAFTTTMVRNVVNESVRTEDRDAYNTDPTGSGPFQLVEWEQEDYATLERWDDYWDADEAGTPNVAGIEFDPIEEQTTRVTSLEQGDNDIIETVPPQMYETVEGMDGASIVEEPGIGYFYLAFNCGEGPTTDPLVREAVDYCFSMDQAVSNFVEPAGVRQVSPYPTTLAEDWEFPLEEWGSITHDQNLEEAQALFEEAGVSMDYDWRIIVPPDDMREQIGVSIGDGLQNAGFENVQVQRLDWGTFTEAYQSGTESDFNMYTLGWSGSPDPDSFAYHLLSQEVEGVTNGTFHGYDEASQKLTRARESADREERQQLYTEATTTLLEERVHIPAYNLMNSYGISSSVEDFHAHAASTNVQIFTDNNNVSVQ